VFDVHWPVSYRLGDAPTEEVRCTAKHWFGDKVLFARHRFQRRRPVFVPVYPGRYRLQLTTTGANARADEIEIDLVIPNGRPVLITCRPAKRRFITAARTRSTWSVGADTA
jgi:hypothetical protein